ncbi:c-type cytochrome [Magnetovibrio sp. PR-2]|uniref:c-type cytochrome n=1 Tax=Magnetovibrio sp. PR-2 TaxID=3120356 RepID=UPI002FCE64A0
MTAHAEDLQTGQAGISKILQDCFHCHGAGGISKEPGFPTIAGQKSEYLRRQLRNFKHTLQGASSHLKNAQFANLREKFPARRDPKMSLVAVTLSDDDIGLLVDSLTRMPCQPSDQSNRSSKITQAEAPKIASRCFGCHETDGVSASAYIPNLARQDKTYLKKQIKLFRMSAMNDQIHATEAKRTHPIMQNQTFQLNEQDIDDVTTYFSSLSCQGKNAAVLKH